VFNANFSNNSAISWCKQIDDNYKILRNKTFLSIKQTDYVQIEKKNPLKR